MPKRPIRLTVPKIDTPDPSKALYELIIIAQDANNSDLIDSFTIKIQIVGDENSPGYATNDRQQRSL